MHLLLMLFFAAAVALVAAVVDPEHDDSRGRVLYGLKVFGAFVGVGLVLGWIIFFIPF